MKKIRIWTFYKGSPVRISVTEKPIVLDAYQVTDEGYNHTVETFQIIDGTVFLHAEHDGRDCDGRMSYENDYVMNGFTEYEGLEIANFDVTKRGLIFDEYAQAAGY